MKNFHSLFFLHLSFLQLKTNNHSGGYGGGGGYQGGGGYGGGGGGAYGGQSAWD